MDSTNHSINSVHPRLVILYVSSFRQVICLSFNDLPQVFLVILAVFFENTGLMKAGPNKAQYEPAEGKTYKFSDVHGVDEAKEVCDRPLDSIMDVK